MAIVKKVLAGVGSLKSWVTANFAKIKHPHNADEVTVAKSNVTDVGTVQAHVELLTNRITTNAKSINYLNGEVTTLHSAVNQRSIVGHAHTATSVNVTGNGTVAAATVQAHIEHLTKNKSNINHTHSIYAAINHTHLLIVALTAAITVSPYTMTFASGTIKCDRTGGVVIVGGDGYGTYYITKNGVQVESGSYYSFGVYYVQCTANDVIKFTNYGQGIGFTTGTWGRLVNVGIGSAV